MRKKHTVHSTRKGPDNGKNVTQFREENVISLKKIKNKILQTSSNDILCVTVSFFEIGIVRNYRQQND